MPPKVIVIGGPNGAGKSTMAPAIVPAGWPFLNADDIARELGGGQDLLAGKCFFEEWDRLHQQRQSFTVESTLAGKSLARRIELLKADGYSVDQYSVWSPAPELCVARVAERVRMGGHDIPTKVIYRRYRAGLRNLFEVYMPLADRWRVMYNASRGRSRVIARGTGTQTQRVYFPDDWSTAIGAVQDG